MIGDAYYFGLSFFPFIGLCVTQRNVSIKLKPLHARWFISLYDYLRNQHDIIKKGFELGGIHSALSVELENEDIFINLM